MKSVSTKAVLGKSLRGFKVFHIHSMRDRPLRLYVYSSLYADTRRISTLSTWFSTMKVSIFSKKAHFMWKTHCGKAYV